jgi:glutamate-ammonia-ligase adenylyltransferase
LKNLLTHPRYIELLFLTFGFSEYLSNLLFIEPELIFTVASEDELLLHKSTAYFSRELSRLCGGENDLDASLAAVRKYRNREMLRIGIRDIYLNLPFERIVREISDLSETIVNCVYHLVLDFEQRNDITKEQAVIAMGKFGGRELNYSSDIDILFVLGPGVDGTARQQEFDRLNRILIRRLSDATSNGRLFRVDTTLRPYGNQGALSGSFSYYLDYYQNRADGWELQAWLKARPIAGDRKNGRKLVKRIQRWIVAPDRKRDIRKSLRKVWNRKTEQLKTEGILDRDVKSGRGGIRTVEFFVQDMQVRLGAEFPEILAPNTLKSIERILRLGLISSEIAKRLRESYIFLRKIEHRVQLFCLQQRHLLPESDRELESLSKRMGYEDRLEESAREQFTAELALHRGFLKRIQDEIKTNQHRIQTIAGKS